ncbi:hypothetical protein ACOBR2_18910 [Telmatobacter bradus]|uniref:hypothetical protein n=1 Tax=Telmatobacter bradus TaxID=474953 RepID=UPI003B4304CA
MKMFLLAGLFVAGSIVACHKEEQAVAGVAQTAVNAEHKAQVTAGERDQQRTQLQQIPLPTKSLYIDIHEASAWTNPFLSVGSDAITLRTSEGAPSARHQDQQIQLVDLARAMASLPPSAWRYGRVVAVAEAPQVNTKALPKVRRNVEAAIQQLNDLGIVVQDWPAR